MSDPAASQPRTDPLPLIELRDVTVMSGGYSALAEASVSFPEGVSTVIMGASGCGKSTLLKVAAGLIPPDRGAVEYRGEDIAGMPGRRLLAMRAASGFVFQDGALWENKSIHENLALPLQVHAADLPAGKWSGASRGCWSGGAWKTRPRCAPRSFPRANARSPPS